MPRAIVTPSLAETLRNMRIQNKIQAKNLASYLGKSPAFISKLENGSIQTIDNDELKSILRFISGEESSVELAEQIYKSLKLKYSTKEIEDQLWFVNYDTVECLLPIPDSIIEDMNTRIERLNISRQYLASRINANEALSDDEKTDNSISYNQWYHSNRDNGYEQKIKIKLPEEKLNKILDKEYEVSPYIFIFCILFYLLKIEKYNNTVYITDENNRELMRETTTILGAHRFLSISEKNRIISEKQSIEEVQEVLSSFDNENIEIINEIISGFQFASDYNIKSTNEQLTAFRDNMRWDLGFMMRIISMNYSSLKETSVSNRKKLLSEIENLIIQYDDLPKEQNKIETY